MDGHVCYSDKVGGGVALAGDDEIDARFAALTEGGEVGNFAVRAKARFDWDAEFARASFPGGGFTVATAAPDSAVTHAGADAAVGKGLLDLG